MNQPSVITADAWTEGGFDQTPAAALPPLLAALGWKGSTRSILEALPRTGQDFDVADLLNAMTLLGFEGHKAELRADMVDDRLKPCLFVARKNGAAHVLQKGMPAKKWHGTAWFFKKTDAETDITFDKSLQFSGMSWFGRLMRRFSGVFWQVGAASLMLNVLALVTPLFMMLVYDRVIGGHSPRTLYYLCVGAALGLAAEFALRFLRANAMAWFGARIDNVVSQKVFERILFLPPSYTDRAPVAAQLSRLKAFDSVREFFAGAAFLTLVEMPFTLVLIAALAFIAGPLALVPVVMGGGYVLLTLVTRGRLKGYSRLSAEAASERHRMGIEMFSRLRTLRLCGAEDAYLEKYRKASGETGMADMRAGLLSAVTDAFGQGIYTLSGMAAVIFGINMIWAGTLTPGGLMAGMMLVWRTLGPVQSFCALLPRLVQVRESIAQVNRLMDMETERNPHVVPDALPPFKGHVEFANVALRYARDSDPVLSNLSFTAKPGEIVAIAGPNGTGKTSILKLASRMTAPQAGTIRLDGADIRQLDPIELRRNLAYAPQDPDMFEGSLGDNLRLVNPLASAAQLWDALEKAGAADTVRGLSDGLDTDARGGISPVLRYQIGLARAHLTGADIMLFDELPYAVLNSPAGEAHRFFLKSAKGRKTILMVTHRRDFMELADKLILLHPDGRAQVNLVTPAPLREKQTQENAS